MSDKITVQSKGSPVSNNILLEKIQQIELLITKGFELVKKNLTIDEGKDFLLHYGLEGYKKKLFDELNVKQKQDVKERMFAKVRQDKRLRLPHKKILEFLIDSYDYEKLVFQEFTFSELVRKCRLGKNKAKEYFDFLADRGYLTKRSDGYDGYRVFYGIME